MKNKHSWILLGGIVLISAAFLLLNFRVAASNIQTDKLIFTTDMGNNMPVPMQRKDKISIVLVGEGPLVRALQKALVSLILEKEYSAISIKEITDRAEVAYISFFRHYNGIDELLMEVLDEGLAELLRHIATLAGQGDGPANEVEGKLIFEYIKQKSDLFRILLKSQSVKRVRKSVVQNIATMFQNSCNFLQRPNGHMPATMASNHMATSLLALIEWWLENKMSPPPPQMGKIYKALIIDGTMSAVASA